MRPISAKSLTSCRRTLLSALVGFLSFAAQLTPSTGIVPAQNIQARAGARADAVPIFATITPTLIRAGTPFWLEVHIGSADQPVTDLFGASFELLFSSQAYIDIVPPDTASLRPGPLLGPDVIFLAVPDRNNGSISVGITRKAGDANVSGAGIVFRARLIVSSDIPDSTSISFTFSRHAAQDSLGNPIILQPREATALVYQPESFQLLLSPAAARVARGALTVVEASLRSIGGFMQPVTLSIDHLPAGVHASFDTLAIRPGETAAATIGTDSSSTEETYLLQITGRSRSVGISRSAPFALTVFDVPLFPAADSLVYTSGTPFDVALRLGDQDRPVAHLARIALTLRFTPKNLIRPVLLDSASLTPGRFLGRQATVAFVPDTAAGLVHVLAETNAQDGASGEGILCLIPFASSFDTPDNTAATFEIVDYAASDADGRPLLLAPGSRTVAIHERRRFTLMATPRQQTITAGERAAFQVSVHGSPSFEATVHLSARGLPAGATAFFQPESIEKNQTARLTMQTDTTAAEGMYRIFLAGASGALSAVDSVQLQIVSAPAFTIEVQPEKRAVTAGKSVTFTVSVAMPAPLDPPVVLDLLPSGHLSWLAYQIDPAVFSAPGQATLTIRTLPEAPVGTYELRAVGKSATSTRTDDFRLTIREPPPPVHPNPFTPNSDGFNDFVYFEFKEFKNANSRILIFDSRGRQVIELNNRSRWDGRDRHNKPLQPGAYFYVVQVEQKVLAKGILALAR